MESNKLRIALTMLTFAGVASGQEKEKPQEFRNPHAKLQRQINDLKQQVQTLTKRVASNEKRAIVLYARAMERVEALEGKVTELESRKPTVTYVQQNSCHICGRRCRFFRRRR